MIYEFRLDFMFHQSLIYLIKNALTFLLKPSERQVVLLL